MAQQLEHERMLVGDATTKTLLKEMWFIPSNRKRALISIALMVWQQMTGVNAVVSPSLAVRGTSLGCRRARGSRL